MLGRFLAERSSLSHMENFLFFSDELLLLDDDEDAEAVEVVDEVGVDGLEVVVESSSIALCKGVTVHLLLLSSLMAEAGLELVEDVWLVMIQPPVVDPVELSL